MILYLTKLWFIYVFNYLYTTPQACSFNFLSCLNKGHPSIHFFFSRFLRHEGITEFESFPYFPKITSQFCAYVTSYITPFTEGRELGFAFFRGWEMGFCALGLGFMKKKTIEKREWDFNLSSRGWDCGIWAGIWKKQFPGKWD